MYLLQNITANGAGTAQEFFGGLMTVFCWGTFDGATVTMQSSPDNVEWFDITNTTFTAKTEPQNAELAHCFVRGNVANKGSNTNVNLAIRI